MPDDKANPQSNLLDRLSPILLLSVVAMAFIIGALWQKVTLLEKGKVAGAEVVQNNNNNPTVEPQLPIEGKLTEDQAKKVPPVSDSDHLRGSKDADVVLIEYSDLECPFCKRFHETAQEALGEFEGTLSWVYRHFPLDSLHPKARTESEASECVAALAGENSFWKFIDKIYEVTPANNGLDLAKLPDYAVGAGVDKAGFEECLKAEKYKDVVDAQYKSGLEAGVTGTPGNFIMNKKGEVWLVPGAVPIEDLRAIINEALGKT